MKRMSPLRMALLGVMLLSWGAPLHAQDQAAWLRQAGEVEGLFQQGSYAEAGRLGQELLGRTRRDWGGNHPNVAQVLGMLAKLRFHEGQGEMVEPLLRESLAIREAFYGRDHPKTVDTLEALSAYYMAEKRWAEAEPLLRETLEGRRKQLGPEHPRIAKYLDNLALVNLNLGRAEAAETLFAEGLQVREAAGGSSPDGATREDSLINLAELAARSGRIEEAERYYSQALTASRASTIQTRLKHAQVLNHMGALRRQTGQLEEAERFFSQALNEVREVYGPDNPQLAVWMSNLGRLHFQSGDFERARGLLTEALGIAGRHFSAQSDHPVIRAIRRNLTTLEETSRQAQVQNQAPAPLPPASSPPASSPPASARASAPAFPGLRPQVGPEGTTRSGAPSAGPSLSRLAEARAAVDGAPAEDPWAAYRNHAATGGEGVEPPPGLALEAMLDVGSGPGSNNPRPAAAPVSATPPGSRPHATPPAFISSAEARPASTGGRTRIPLGCFSQAEYLAEAWAKARANGWPAYERRKTVNSQELTCLVAGPFPSGQPAASTASASGRPEATPGQTAAPEPTPEPVRVSASPTPALARVAAPPSAPRATASARSAATNSGETPGRRPVIGEFYIPQGCFGQVENTQQAWQSLGKAELPGFRKQAGAASAPLHCVFAGPFATREEAEMAVVRLHRVAPGAPERIRQAESNW